jgi:SAM-dependent methyltransferase
MQGRIGKSVLDIGSNDGTQLKYYKALGYSVLGVESSKSTAAIANEHGIDTLEAFFNREVAQSLNRRFDLINAAGVFFHLEELHSVTDGIRECLKDDGVFVVQFLYMKQIIENVAFDQIYHEHLLYYNLETIQKLLARHGLAMFDCYLSPIHGGSIIGFVTHAGKRLKSLRLEMMLAAEKAERCNELDAYRRFGHDILQKKRESLEFLSTQRAQGRQVFGMGAPVKGNTLLNYFGIGPELVECLVEKNPLRKGLVSPGMHIPIVLEDEIPRPPDTYYVLAWNFKEEILNNNRSLIDAGVTFYFPVESKVNESPRYRSHRLSRIPSYPRSENEWASGDWSEFPGLQPVAGGEPAQAP